MFTGYIDHANGSKGRSILAEGYWTFEMLMDKLKGENITLGASNDYRYFHTKTESPNKVEINRGLRYVEVSCDIVVSSRVIDPHGKRSNVIYTLPVTADGSLKVTVVHYTDIESRVPVNKGSFNSIKFKVRANNDTKFVGSVLLDLYIM